MLSRSKAVISRFERNFVIRSFQRNIVAGYRLTIASLTIAIATKCVVLETRGSVVSLCSGDRRQGKHCSE